MIDVAIVDTGGANIASVRYALARLGRSGTLVSNPEDLAGASHIILPGVGAAGEAMKRLHASGMADALRNCGQPVLGICLGLQLLCARSEEDGLDCLGVVPGSAQKLQATARRPVPHMGWNTVDFSQKSRLLKGVPTAARFYFVHSYAVPLMDCTTGSTDYGETFSSVIEHRNFFGTQFHPERSSTQGATVLANFMELS